MSDLNPEQTDAIEKIQKLLNLAAKNPNEAEAASATAKAQELLARYNLDVATVEGESGKKDGKREQFEVDGGFYEYQRDLWKAVAQLNFCVCWTQQYIVEAWRYVDDYTGAKSMAPGDGKTRQKVKTLRNRQCLVGRMVNTRSTAVMAKYLLVAVERVLDERLQSHSDNMVAKNSTWAISYRRGAVSRIVEMVTDRREANMAEQREKARKAARSATGASTATSLTISAYSDQETDANMDFIYGEGWSAKQALDRANRAAERTRREEAYTAWAKANPEEAAEKHRLAKEASDKEAKKSRWRGGSSPRDNTDYSAYYSGYDAAKKISIDQQVDGNSSSARRLK